MSGLGENFSLKQSWNISLIEAFRLRSPSHSPAKGRFADNAMQPVHRLRQYISTWRLATSFDQKTSKLGYTISGLPCAIMN